MPPRKQRRKLRLPELNRRDWPKKPRRRSAFDLKKKRPSGSGRKRRLRPNASA